MSEPTRTENVAPAPSDEVSEPSLRDVEIPRAAVEKMVDLSNAAVIAARERDAFVQGLCSGLAIDSEQIVALDVARNVLVVRDA